MGVLRKLGDGTLVPLPARLLVGRARTSGLRLATSVASGEHASLVWTGSHWDARDLGSTNGTLVGETRLEPGKPHKLGRGSTLVFGGPDETWVLDDDAPPDALATDVASGELTVAKAGLLALPTAADPALSIYKSTGGEWVSEDGEGEVRPVLDQAVVSAGGRSWRLHLPLEAEGTPMIEPRPSFATVKFVFRVSKNEEMIDISVVHKGRPIPLESREHGYVLLTLARVRRAEEDLSVGERGWVDRDELLRMLGMDANAMNVAIHRARQQLLAAGIEGAQGIVEVRRGHRRFGTDRFEITAI